MTYQAYWVYDDGTDGLMVTIGTYDLQGNLVGNHAATGLGAGQYGALLTLDTQGGRLTVTGGSSDPVHSGYPGSERSNIDRLVSLAEADESVTPDRYQKIARGTEDILLDKQVTSTGPGYLEVTG
jgi:hypothetical protein